MAKTVDNHSTIEDFRRRYNELATDVGDVSGLRDSIKTLNGGTLVDAVNAIEDKVFFFKEYTFTATSGQQTFTGDDDTGVELKFKPNRLQVFKNNQHLVSDVDYTVGNPSGGFFFDVILTSGATLNDVITVYSFTGSFEGTGASDAIAGYFVETAQNTIYNSNQNGVILNGDNATPTTSLQPSYTIQLAGKTYVEENLTLASGKTLTAPIITDGTAQITGGVGTSFSSITSTSFIGNLTGNVTSTGTSTFSNIDVNGGAIDGAVIGANSAAAITGTTITASTGFSGNLTGNVTGNTSGSSGTTTSISNHNLGALGNVSSTAASNGQLLIYNSSTSQWEPDDIPANYTDEQAQDAAASMITAGTHTNITVTYNDANNTLSFTGSNSVTGGNGLTLTGTDMSVNTSNGVKITSDNVVLDYETTSTAPSSVGSTSTGHLWFVI